MNYEQVANENARQNYSIHTDTFDEDHLLQFSCGGEVLGTLSKRDVRGVEAFVLFNGTGLDDDDNDLPIKEAVKVFQIEEYEEASSWRAAVKFSYGHVLAKMMLEDERSSATNIMDLFK